MIPCDFSVSPWSKSFFFSFLGDFYSTWGPVGTGGLGLGPGLDKKDMGQSYTIKEKVTNNLGV